MQLDKLLNRVNKTKTLHGAAVLLASISLIVLGTALVLAQSTAAKSDTKATVYATDQNLAAAAAATAVSAGTTYVNALSTKPTACSSSTGCATVYSGTALSGGATSQSDSWWTTSGNVHTATCSSLSAAGDLKCAYVVEQSSCDTSTGNIGYTVTGYGYYSSTNSTYSKNITTSKSSATVTRNAFATLGGTTAVTFRSPTICPITWTYFASQGQPSTSQAWWAFTQANTLSSITLNGTQPGSTFSSGTGSITTVGVAARGGINTACSLGNSYPLTIKVVNDTTAASQTGNFSVTTANTACTVGCCGNGVYQGYQLISFSLPSSLAVTYGDSVHVELSASSYGSQCQMFTSTYGGGKTSTSSTSSFTILSGDMNSVIYSLSGTVATYSCP